MDKYEIIIFWSEEDNAFIAEVPELPGCMAHGDSHEAALSNIRSAMELWIESAKEFGDPIPEPKGHRLVLSIEQSGKVVGWAGATRRPTLIS